MIFSKKHSFRWAEHVRAWRRIMCQGKTDIDDIFLDWKKTPLDVRDQHYTPVGIALLYVIAMDQKMQIEEQCMREALAIDEASLDNKIDEDTEALMRTYIDEAEKHVDEPLSPLVNDASFDELSFNSPMNPREWIHVLQTDHRRMAIFNFLRGRLAQQHRTLRSAVTAYHAIVHGAGLESYTAAAELNKEPIAWRITAMLSNVMGATGIQDHQSMRTDHVIETNASVLSRLKMMLLWTRASSFFYNCPIMDAYKVADEQLAEKYGSEAGFMSGNMVFCKVCHEHGRLASDRLIPVFIGTRNYSASEYCLSNGADHCTFSHEMIFSVREGHDRLFDERALAMMENPPPIQRVL